MPPEEELAVRCRACGATFAPPAWSSLTVLERIDAREVQRVVSGWPEGTCVEVRCCGSCGRNIVKRSVASFPDQSRKV